MKHKQVAVVLSGSGVYDGSEIHEAVLTLLAIDQQGATYQCFAPDIMQHHVINHLTGEASDEARNVLVESARLARGNIKPLSDFDADKFDAIIFPGGFGAAKNLSSFAFEGADCSVDGGVDSAVKAMLNKGKPIGALCISPAVLARIVPGAKVTIGEDEATASAIESMGGRHQRSGHGAVVVDEAHNLVTSPCYMLEATVSQIADDAAKTVAALLERTK
ncbi:MAG: isoprenoid biosynthesis glyoxalase ElbB [Gammaproteobacteria bacterium]|nr:isoprenoid biosynthesis glyoxalase ElbB [Gammaproteobacteria bacterium]MCP5407034.1 isoprenoid biosynthesis glyoxalase ElbB [Chromatiaceae bacterium]MCP5445120.1 isoprenoid biosynthesis glyoxalase ElbB [Chromatiaceae bacterium]